ncbi:MAG: heme exporter protein CcmB [Candidatus Puniceispirillales bacterium WSBS_2018_MAG_OTU23]
MLLSIMARDLMLAWRGAADIIAGLSFFIIIIMLIPLALGPDPKLLRLIAPAVLWIAAMLACLPQMDRLYTQDAADGGLDHLLMVPLPLPIIVLAKAIAAWVSIGLPLVLASPLMAAGLGLPVSTSAIIAIMAALAIGSFTLILLGMAASALVLGARRGGALMAILTLPLAMPILIFGTATVAAAATGGDVQTPLILLAAMTLVMLAITPMAAAISLRHAAE